jgi:hypothetical protein
VGRRFGLDTMAPDLLIKDDGETVTNAKSDGWVISI